MKLMELLKFIPDQEIIEIRKDENFIYDGPLSQAYQVINNRYEDAEVLRISVESDVYTTLYIEITIREEKVNMKIGDKVKISKGVLNGNKMWKKGEIVKITGFKNNYGGKFVEVVDKDGKLLLQPIEWLEEIPKKNPTFKMALRELEIYKNVFCTGEELPGIKRAIQIITRMENNK